MHEFPGQRRSALAADVESSLRHGSYFLGLVIICQVVNAAGAVDAAKQQYYIFLISTCTVCCILPLHRFTVILTQGFKIVKSMILLCCFDFAICDSMKRFHPDNLETSMCAVYVFAKQAKICYRHLKLILGWNSFIYSADDSFKFFRKRDVTFKISLYVTFVL